MSLSTIDFNTTFNYVPATKVFKFEDTVDYSGQSVAIANATGVIKVVSPAGTTIYNNTNHNSPDIDPDVSRINTTTIPLPLMGDGSVMQGLYSVTYTVRVVDTTLATSYDVAKTKTFTLSYSSPEVDLDMEANCTTPLLSSTDNTSYTQNFVNPTITRVHKIYYPASLGISPVSGTGATVSTSTIYVVSNQALQYSSDITSTLSYDYGSGWYVSDEVSGNGYIDVLCDNSLCDIYCALRAQYNRWQSVKGTSMREQEEKSKFEVMVSLAHLTSVAIDCGKNSQATEYINQIKSIGNFDDCSCSDGTTPTLVTGLGSAGTVTVAAGSGVSVATATGGGTTTYTVSLDAATLDIINNAYNTVVAGGTGISVAVVTAADGTKTYTITNTQTAPDSLNQIFDIRFASGSLPSINTDSSTTTGTAYQAATLAADNNGSSADWQVNNAFFTVSAFFSGSNVAFYPEVDVNYTLKTSFSLNPYSRPYVMEIVNYDSTTFTIRFTDRITGQVVTGSAVEAAYTRIKLQIKLSK